GAALAAVLAAAGLLAAAPGPALAAAPVLFSDDFEDGDAAGWRPTGGRWSVVQDGTQVLSQAGSSANARVRAGDPAWRDYSVSASAKLVSGRDAQSSVGVQARVQSDGSHYYLTVRSDGTTQLGRVVRGRATTLATVATYPVTGPSWRSLTLVAKGSTLLGIVDGRAYLSATDGQLSAGRAGLSAGYAAAVFDNVAVRSYAPTTPDTTAPLTPAAPTVVDVTPTTATITWPATVDNVGVVDYLIYQGSQFYQQSPVRFVTGTGPVTLNLSPTGGTLHFAVAARDAAGNMSPISGRATIPQPPSFPKSGDDTVRPTPPGAPQVTGSTGDGRLVLSWTPATDNLGVVEYHVYLVTNIDEVRVLAKVREPSAAVAGGGSYNPRVWVVAYDAAWNSATGPSAPFGGQTPPPPPPPS
ncbi:MAG TPA: hypothetical protein VES42_20120, partial [Pilimelia sp.]|nr:hypothetical protein [Pilimelia sp.]